MPSATCAEQTHRPLVHQCLAGRALASCETGSTATPQTAARAFRSGAGKHGGHGHGCADRRRSTAVRDRGPRRAARRWCLVLASSSGRRTPSFLATWLSTLTISSADGAATRMPRQRLRIAPITCTRERGACGGGGQRVHGAGHQGTGACASSREPQRVRARTQRGGGHPTGVSGGWRGNLPRTGLQAGQCWTPRASLRPRQASPLVRTLLELLQHKKYRQLVVYFSMMRRRACCALLVSLSASLMTTTLNPFEWPPTSMDLVCAASFSSSRTTV